MKKWIKEHKIWSIIIILLIIFFVFVYFSPEDSKEVDLTGEVIDEDIQNTSKQVETQEQQEQTQKVEKCEVGFLDEYRCKGDDIQRKYQHSNCIYNWFFEDLCSFGCENAKCKPCYDSDGGKDYYTRGYIYYSVGGNVFDECRDESKGYLTELYCKDDEPNEEDYKNFKMEFYVCPNGCSNGRCNLEPEETTPEDSGHICSYNAYNCDDFNTHAEAQAVYESCGGVSNDVHRLDRDKDGSACEVLP